jgi:hypothetical protein
LWLRIGLFKDDLHQPAEMQRRLCQHEIADMDGPIYSAHAPAQKIFVAWCNEDKQSVLPQFQ